MKKILSYCTTALAVAIFTLSVSASDAKLPFADVEDSWYLPYVEKVYEKGYMTGVSETEFAPDSGLTRAMFVTVLGRIHGEEAESVPCSFSDVPQDAWYRDYVGWAEKSEIVLGYPDGTFRGSDLISRQELAAITSRYLDFIKLSLSDSENATEAFADADLIDSYAVPHVEKLRACAVFLGDENGNFKPDDTASRAEAAAITTRIDTVISDVNKSPCIAGEPLSSYSIYSEYLATDKMTVLSDMIKEKTDISLPVSTEKTDRAIVFDVDEDLRTLEYKVSEKDSCLTVSVSTKFAAPYFDRILADVLSKLDKFIIPANYSQLGTYEIDNAVDCGGSVKWLCETNKNPLGYSVNDKVTFRVTMLCGDRLVSAPTFKYTYRNDGNTNESISGIVSGISGQAVITVDGAEVPGAGRLDVSASNRRGQKLSKLGDDASMIASVIFDIANITPAREMPSDFNKFWDEQMDALMAVEPNAIKFEKCEDYSDNEYDVYDVWVETPGGMSVSHISVPKNATPNSLIIRSYYDGYGSPRADKADKHQGEISVSVNPHSIDNHETSEYYEEFEKSISGWGFENSSYFLGMLMRDIQAIRFAEIQFADIWNGKDIVSSGGSMGGFQAVAVAGLYDNVTECRTSITWMCDIGGPTKNRMDGWRPAYNDTSKYYDSCYFVTRFKGELNISGGLGDYTCPPSGLVSLFNSANQAKRVVFSLNQCMEHGSGGSSFNESYRIYSDKPTPEQKDTFIRDNGCAVEVPDYSADRQLTESEEAMKTAAEALRAISEDFFEFDSWIGFNFETSNEISAEEIEAKLYEVLTVSYSLDPSCRIEVDEDTLASLKEAHQACDGLDYDFVLDYSIYDTSNGFYDAKVNVYISKQRG